jgi:hypothetical protein
LEKFADTSFVIDLENELRGYVAYLSEPMDLTSEMSDSASPAYESTATSFKASWSDGALVIYFQVTHPVEERDVF